RRFSHRYRAGLWYGSGSKGPATSSTGKSGASAVEYVAGTAVMPFVGMTGEPSSLTTHQAYRSSPDRRLAILSGSSAEMNAIIEKESTRKKPTVHRASPRARP